MGKYVLPLLVITAGVAAAWAGWKLVRGTVEPATTGVGGFRLGQVLRPESEWEKNKRSEGILLSIG